MSLLCVIIVLMVKICQLKLDLLGAHLLG